MKNILKKQFDYITNLSSRDRNLLLCQLATKEAMNTIQPEEIIQLAIIQSIRQANGEIDKVLQNWEEHPECDPRIKIN